MKKPTSIVRLLGGVLAFLIALPVIGDSSDIRSFVHQTYIGGVPYTEVAKMSTGEAMPVLLEMLNDPLEEEYLPNIVVTLGMLGDDRTVAPLIGFISRPESRWELSRSQSTAKTSAVMALGYIVNKTGNAQALAYLEEGINPQVWEGRNLQWTSDFYPSTVERNNQMAIMSILGLGVSGNPEAGKILRELQQPAPASRTGAAVSQALPTLDSSIVNEALKAHEDISRNGLKQYYERFESKRRSK